MRVVRGYPVIDSAAFQELVGGPGLADRKTKHDAVELWIETLREALGESYEIVDSDHFTAIGVGDTDALLVQLETSLQHLRERLRGIADERWGENPLALLFDRPFDDYFSAIDGGDGERFWEHAAFIPATPWLDQFLFAPAPPDTYLPAIRHGLAHSMTISLTCPHWMSEVVAAYAADEPVRDFERSWTDDEARAFRSGQSFFDGEAREASRARAARLAHKLSSDYDAFTLFVRKAHWRDHGEAAAREVYGVGLRTLLER